MSHINAAICDGWLCTGSANFDKLSLKDNLELNVATSYQPAVRHFEEVLFEKDFKKSKEMQEPLKTTLKKLLAEIVAEQL